MRKRVLLSWSRGKDSAWALHLLRQQNEFDVVGLFTMFTTVTQAQHAGVVVEGEVDGA